MAPERHLPRRLPVEPRRPRTSAISRVQHRPRRRLPRRHARRVEGVGHERRHDAAKPSRSTAALFDEAGAPVRRRVDAARGSPAARSAGDDRVPRPRPHKWSADDAVPLSARSSPLKDARRQGARSDPARVGFRKVEIKDGRFLINGQADPVKGVNRHEHSPDTGQVRAARLHDPDIELMKQFNVNAVRTSHYPERRRRGTTSATATASTCIDEANIECHGYGNDAKNRLDQRPGDGRRRTSTASSGWSSATRTTRRSSSGRWATRRATARTSAAGYQWTEAARRLRARSTTRQHQPRRFQRRHQLVHVPPAGHRRRSARPKRPDMPLILCEYSHAMGNSATAA